MEETRRLQLASASKPCTPAHLMHKSQLQEYAQRLALQFPVYHSINEGFPHVPKFRASVVVDREEYESTQTFPHQKDAEQDVAKIALESIFKRINNEAYCFILLNILSRAILVPIFTYDFDQILALVICIDHVKIYFHSLGTPAHLMHKNRLQEYAQRLALQFPVYHSINEGFPHAPKFRASVVVDGEEYESTQTFPHQKDAEQDVAKIALESIFKRIKNEAYSFIYEDTLFCKSILTEFAVKMNLEMPKYNTQSVEKLSAFVSSLIFNGKCYTGGARKNKKEAEQMVARTAILSFLGNSHTDTLLSQMIKSKIKLYRGKNVVGNLDSSPGNPSGKRKGTDIALASDKAPHFQVKKSKQELFSEVGFGSSGRKWQGKNWKH